MINDIRSQGSTQSREYSPGIYPKAEECIEIETLLTSFNKLNHKGKNEAIRIIEDLIYQKNIDCNI